MFTFQMTGSGRVQVFVDEASVLDVAALAPSPTYDKVAVGAVRTDEIGFRGFVDDVVIADRRIGCN